MEFRALPAFVVLLLVAPIFVAPVQAIEYGINNDQQNTVDAWATNDQPHGNWITKTEWTNFYLHTQAPAPSVDAGRWGDGLNAYPSKPESTNGENFLWVDTQAPTGSACGVVNCDYTFAKRLNVGTQGRNQDAVLCGVASPEGNLATFNHLGYGQMPAPAGVQGDFDSLSLYSMSATVYATLEDPGHRIFVDVWRTDAATGARIDDDGSTCVGPWKTITLRPAQGTTSTAVGDIAAFTGSIDLDLLDGVTLPDGHILSYDLRSGGNVETTEVALDSRQLSSRISILTDSARLNWWSEDRLGNPVDRYPSGEKVQTEDTRIRFKLLVADMFGNEDCSNVATGGRAWDCAYDGFDQRDFVLRMRNLDNGQLFPIDLGRGLVGGDPGQDNRTARCCNNDFRLMQYTNLNGAGDAGLGLLEYTVAYDETFPDGTYQLEFRNKASTTGFEWEDRHVVHIGGESFDLVPAPEEVFNTVYQTDENGDVIAPLTVVEVAHTVGTNEATDYHLRLINTGKATDTFGLSVPVPGAGWRASVQPSEVTIPAKQSADIIVTVTPSSTALTGSWRAVTLNAVSLLSDDKASIRLNTTLTSDVTRSVRVFSPTGVVEASPGLPRVFPVSIINEGTHADTFVTTHSGLPAGWIVDLNPPYTTHRAMSSQDVAVTVTPPPEAQGGQSATLVLRTQRVADSAVFDELKIPVQIIIRDDFEVVPDWGLSREVRDVEQDIFTCDITGFFCGEEDWDLSFDHSTLFRYTLKNTGDRTDTFDLTASWVSDTTQDLPGCDGGTSNSGAGNMDGVPDGWRFRILPTEGIQGEITTIPAAAQWSTDPDGGWRGQVTSSPFSGDMRVGKIELEARESREFWIEMAWLDYPSNDTGCNPHEDSNCGSGCYDIWRNAMPAEHPQLRLSTRSTNDPTAIDVKTMEVNLIHTFDAGGARSVINPDRTSDAARNEVGIELQDGETVAKTFEKNSSAVHQLRAINLGNEFDTLTIGVSEEAPGWVTTITDWTFLPADPTFYNVATTGTATISHTPRCEYPSRGSPPAADLTTIVCQDVGVHEEVHFNVTATPPANHRIGDRDQVKLTVGSSGLAGLGQIKDEIRVESIVGGNYLFEVEERDQILQVGPGRTAAFPFSVHNLGLADDTYEFVISLDNPDYNARLSSEQLVRVPAGYSHHGYLSIIAPTNLPDGEEQRFRVQVRSVEGNKQLESMDFIAQLDDDLEVPEMFAPSETLLQGKVGSFNVTAVAPGDYVTFTIDPEVLPRGYTLVCDPNTAGNPTGCKAPFNNPYRDGRSEEETAGVRQATGGFFVSVPENELSTSRIAVRVTGNTTGDFPAGTLFQYVDTELNLATVYGISLDTSPVRAADGGNVGVVAPGQAFTHNVVIKNTGLSPQTVSLSSSALPQGWDLVFSKQRSIFVQPGQEVTVQVVMEAPDQAISGAEAAIRVFATVAEDPSKQASLTLITKIGHYEVNIDAQDETIFLGPQEAATFRIELANQGTVRDTIDTTLTLPTAYRSAMEVTWSGGSCDTVIPRTAGGSDSDACRNIGVEPGVSKILVVTVRYAGAESLAGGTIVPVSITGKSILAPRVDPALCPDNDISKCADPNVGIATDTGRMEYLAYVAQDVDRDQIMEYAIDRDRDPTTGFEEFSEDLLNKGAGISSVLPDLARFLTDDARKALTVVVTDETGSKSVLRLRIDGDDDGKVDFLIDTTKDGLPNVYWDPDRTHVYRITTVRDVTQDGVPELFIDNDGDGRMDVYYNLATGVFGKLIQRFVDGDEFIDYVVDLNGNGKTDNNEPILFGGPGGIVRSLVKADVDGDGNLDEVYDIDGDGAPDYFVPYNSNKKFAITMRDMNGDGVEDWVFDADADGKEDSYYDTVTGKSQTIDARSDFARSVQEFWYILVMFGLVLVLFLVLVAVTRR